MRLYSPHYFGVIIGLVAALFLHRPLAAQCVTMDMNVSSFNPPQNAGCQGSAYLRFIGSNNVFYLGYFNLNTGASFGRTLNGCGSGCTYDQLNINPGDYRVEVADVSHVVCATFLFTVPAYGPQHEMTLQVTDDTTLPDDPCDGTGALTVAYSLPVPNCLPPVSARLYLGNAPTGDWITAVVSGGSLLFADVPLAESYFVVANAGPLGEMLAIPHAVDPCPALGGAPATTNAAPDAPGSISGVVPQLGCPVAVAVVAVQGGASLSVVWDDDTHWHASAPAGQYAVAIGTSGGACVEEHVVEVGDQLPSCGMFASIGGSAQTVFGQADGQATLFLTNTQGHNGGTLRVVDANGATAQELIDPSGVVTVPGLRAGTYSFIFLSTDPACQSDLGSYTVPCAANTHLFADQDNDGFGDAADRITACNPVAGYVLDSLDCNVNVVDQQHGTLYSYDGDNDHVYGAQRVYCGVPPEGYVPISEAPIGPDCDDGDATVTLVVGAACDDGDNCTVNDRVGTDCTCEGTNEDADGDEICDGLDGCLGTSGSLGDPCDDNDPNTVNDELVISGTSCACAGTPCAPGNILSLSINTDNNGDDISWSVMDYASNEVVCSGTDLANNTVVTASCCVEQGHCYKVSVLDAAGDGIGAVHGGYVVRVGGPSGPRLIDNSDNFRTGGSSAISGTERLCWSLGQVKVVDADCDKRNWLKRQHLRCTEDPDVSAAWIPNASNSAQPANTGYEFWFYDPNGSFNEVYFRSHQRVVQRVRPGPVRATHFVINDWDPATVPHLPGNKLLNVRVRAKVNGVSRSWGPACRFKLDPSREDCPVTELINDPSERNYSCNVSRSTGRGQKLYATPVYYALRDVAASLDDKYQFRFRNVAGEPTYESFASVSRNWVLINQDLAGAPLVAGRTYEVDVRVSMDDGNTWCVGGPLVTGPYEPWGEVCTVTVVPASGLVETAGRSSDVADIVPVLYPNPNNGEQVMVAMNELPSAVEHVTLSFFDLLGEQLWVQQLPAQDGMLRATVNLKNTMGAGVYLVTMAVGDRTFTQRLVVQ
ncbi:MAG: T9SS type A sorting domain-containing protein [Flavobacteriales bacterium]|nr:T9SS type A sorting domain-containing protein [Flavobacteriales bacterium]